MLTLPSGCQFYTIGPNYVIQNGIFSGIKIGKEKVCLLQYADDAVLFLDGSEKNV